jgi:tight adherence protein C
VSTSIIGSLVGLMAASGVLIAYTRYRAMTPMTISERVIRATHGSIPQLNALIPFHSQSGALSSLREFVSPNSEWITRFGNTDKLMDRLQKAGKTTGERNVDLVRFRWEQITWAALGLVAGVVIGMWSISQGSNPITLGLTMTLGTVIGFLVHDRHVSGLGKKRVERIDAQFPDLAELLAFSVTAGETPLAALTRIAHLGNGDLTQELQTCVAEIKAGSSFIDALQAMSERTGSRCVERFVSGLVIAIERGTPLSGVLRAQAEDTRNEQRQYLIELAGKKDVFMLVPVVFFILPTVIVIALFPAMRGLEVLVP